MKKPTKLCWFRQDLRLKDNLALNAAASDSCIIPIYILDEVNPEKFKLGRASRIWLHYSLEQLNKELDGNLLFFKGDPELILAEVTKKLNISEVYWNRCYEPWRIARDSRIKEKLFDTGIKVHSYNGALLWEPWEIAKADGTPYRVFTPFYRKGCLNATLPRKPITRPRNLNFITNTNTTITDLPSCGLDELNLLPDWGWDKKIIDSWDVGEKAAERRLKVFLKDGINDYKDGRNFPSKTNVSRLSAYLHWGEISPNTIWHAVQESLITDKIKPELQDKNKDTFLSELGWREFSHSLLYHFPSLPTKNLQSKFDRFPWQENQKDLKAWQSGSTGYPIVDAGMRELWQTGYMHNRVRMIVGSFLVKNLLIHWHHGESWFWDTLVDADLANNSASWQWIAGCGADAAPYFRIFNPVTQGKRFDSDGDYTRRYIPELSALPDKYLFAPWEAPDIVLKQAGVELGKHYPKPICDLKISRERALKAFSQVKVNT